MLPVAARAGDGKRGSARYRSSLSSGPLVIALDSRPHRALRTRRSSARRAMCRGYGLRKSVGRMVLVAGFVAVVTAFVAVVTSVVTGFVTEPATGATA